jgi:type IX secretion system PorP/SprF family membrane protein
MQRNLADKIRYLLPRIGLFVLCFALHSEIISQDPVYSQYYNAPLQLNPGFAGNSHAPVFAINYRNQWPAVNNAYQTYSVSYDQFFDQINSGLGVFILGDSAGDGIIKTIKLSGIYSYRIFLNDKLQAKIGLEASLLQTRLDWDRLIFFDQIDPSFGNITPGGIPIPSGEIRPENTNHNFFDVSMGMLLYSPSFYGGISLKHINSPNDQLLNQRDGSYSGLPLRWSIHAGAQLPLDGYNNEDSETFISPNVLFVKQSNLKQLNVGAVFNYRTFLLGTWYRHAFENGDAGIFSVGVRSGIFKISYSFDLTISDLGINRTGGSHEVGVIVNMEKLFPKPSRYSDCFNIFR